LDNILRKRIDLRKDGRDKTSLRIKLVVSICVFGRNLLLIKLINLVKLHFVSLLSYHFEIFEDFIKIALSRRLIALLHEQLLLLLVLLQLLLDLLTEIRNRLGVILEFVALLQFVWCFIR
jgi:hypothetical protein